MDPLSLLLMAAPPAYKMIKGIAQGEQAKNKKFELYVPPTLKRLDNRLKSKINLTTDAVAEGQRRAIKSGTAEFGSKIAKTARTSGDVINALGGYGAQQANAEANVMAGFGQRKEEWERKKIGTEQQIAGYESKSRDEYARDVAALKSASATNIFGGLSDMATVGVQAMLDKKEKRMEGDKTAEAAEKPGIFKGLNPSDIYNMIKTGRMNIDKLSYEELQYLMKLDSKLPSGLRIQSSIATGSRFDK